jgi:hypothetical protein
MEEGHAGPHQRTSSDGEVVIWADVLDRPAVVGSSTDSQRARELRYRQRGSA